MLRYNNQSTKPVDYYRPLTVDCSVEYELPKEVSPPPGSAPLLIIHPSAYFRSKVHQPSSSNSSSSSSSSSPSLGHHHGAAHRGISSITGRSSRHQDLNLYLGSSRSLSNSTNNNHTSSNNNHIGTGGSSMAGLGGRHHASSDGMMLGSNSNSRNYRSNASNQTSSLSSSLNRSRNLGLSGTSDLMGRSGLSYLGDYGGYGNDLQRSNASHSYLSSSGSSASSRIGNNNSAMKKPTGERMGAGNDATSSMMMRDLRDRLATYGFSNSNAGSNSSSNGTSSSFGNTSNLAGSPMMIGSKGDSPGLNTFGVPTSTAASMSNNKRLRMMNAGNTMMEPLNLAVSGSNSLLNSTSVYHSSSMGNNSSMPHMSTFLGGSYKENSTSHGSNSHGATHSSSHGLNFGSSFSNTNNNNYYHSRSAPQNILHQYSLSGSSTSGTGSSLSGRYSKEGPIPVDKGSGSDSGVCSENDSDSSPSMQPYTSTSGGHHVRRNSLLSQDLPGSGCYCCCCPSSTPGSKNKSGGNNNMSNNKLKSTSSNKHQSYLQNPLGVNSSNLGLGSTKMGNANSNSGSSSSSGRSLLNYGMSSVNPTISMNMMAFQPDVHLNGMSALDGSPASMAAAAAAMMGATGSSPLDLDLSYRKWLGSGIGGHGAGPAPGLVVDGSGPGLGRWFQV